MADEKRYMSPQIARYVNNKSILEFNSKLAIADVENAFKIHAGTDEMYPTEKGKKPVKKTSKIGVKILQYDSKSNKAKDSVEANMEVSDVKKLWCVVQSATERVYGEFVSQTKVHAFNKDENGLSKVQILSIAREEKDASGVKYKLEWNVSITNGRAKALATGVGYEKNTFVKDNQFFVRISKQDFFALISQLNTTITAWENWAGSILFSKRMRMEIAKQEQNDDVA